MYDRSPWLKEIAQCAVLAERRYGTPATRCVAHAAVESGWGECAIGNNHFGMKAVARHTAKQDVVTHEWLTPAEAAKIRQQGHSIIAVSPPPDSAPPEVGEEYYQIIDTFADYPSMQASVDDWAWLLSCSGLYVGVWRWFQMDKNPDIWVRNYMRIYASANKANLVNNIARQKNVIQAVAKARAEVEQK